MRATGSSDKADFALCAVVRVFFVTQRGELLPDAQRVALEDVLTTFPYWVDLPGARPSEMCFWTVRGGASPSARYPKLRVSQPQLYPQGDGPGLREASILTGLASLSLSNVANDGVNSLSLCASALRQARLLPPLPGCWRTTRRCC